MPVDPDAWHDDVILEIEKCVTWYSVFEYHFHRFRLKTGGFCYSTPIVGVEQDA